ncbi:GGDEF domain-containing protein [Demequina zhanjiangensis]|uniref:GGDEF domain-containing protein n=1 Tax=Demequina zhanjiangensis TaxID=3051659 RepID=A0ABT8G1F9_9MICO|nr:GGDEF domain-containing protein [Demequina sp. SYSU T00b26]MDN4472976.1 GGDEF domain-containing protein [Demequina sp. SYSU T00b26]
MSAAARVHWGVAAMALVSVGAALFGGATASALAVAAMSLLVTWAGGVRMVRSAGFVRLFYATLFAGFVLLDFVTLVWFVTVLLHGDMAATHTLVQLLMGVSYLFLLAAAALVVRRSASRDTGGVLDAATLAVAGASALWQVLLAPALEAGEATLAERAYIFAIVIILAGSIGVVVGLRANRVVPREALPVMRYYGAALVVTVAGNALGAMYADPVTGIAPWWVGAFWPLAFACAWGAIAHPVAPSSLELGEPHPSRLTSTRIVMLGVAVVLTPVVSVARSLTGGYVGWLASAGATITLVVMVLTRVNQLAQAHREAEARLRLLAERDVLTGLPNRRAVDRHLADAAARVASGKAEGIVVCFIDLNGFKEINDTRGHAIGDELLVAIAVRLDRLMRHDGSDLVGRLGGDEFVMVVEGPAHAADALATRVRTSLGHDFSLSDGPARASASIGLATGTPGELPTVDEMLTRADHAMYADKQEKRDASAP